MSTILMDKYYYDNGEVYATPLTFSEYRKLRNYPKVPTESENQIDGFFVIRIGAPYETSRSWVDKMTFKRQARLIEMAPSI